MKQPDRVRDGRHLMDHVPPDPRFWLADALERADRAIANDLRLRAARFAQGGVIRIPLPRRFASR